MHCRIRQISHTDAELEKREKINRLTASWSHVLGFDIRLHLKEALIETSQSVAEKMSC